MATAAGQKAQEDSRLGQGSIFDLGGGGGGGPGRRAAPSTPRSASTSTTSASCCGWRRRRSAPSSPRIRWPRSATRCGPGWTARLSELGSKPDGSFVTVGGIVTEFKRHKTKRGDPMAFADPRRRRGPGRHAGPRQGLRPSRSSASAVDSVADRQGPPRPPGARPDQADRAGGRALRAHRGRGRPGPRRRRAPQPIVLADPRRRRSAPRWSTS